MEQEIKKASENVLKSIAVYCRLLVNKEDSPCSEGDCEFCPINHAYRRCQDMIQNGIENPDN